MTPPPNMPRSVSQSPTVIGLLLPVCLLLMALRSETMVWSGLQSLHLVHCSSFYCQPSLPISNDTTTAAAATTTRSETSKITFLHLVID
jgi:hypothetical protein